MEEFLQKWATMRFQKLAKKKKKTFIGTWKRSPSPSCMKLELPFTLKHFLKNLEHHTDIAFDFFEASRLVSKKSNGPQTYLRLLLYFPRQEGLDSDFMITMEIVDEVEQLRKPSGWGSFPFYASNSTATKTKSLLPITIRRDWNARELVNAPGRNKFQVI